MPAFEFTHSNGIESFDKLFYPKIIEPIEGYLETSDSVLTIDDQWVKISDVVRITEPQKDVDDLVYLQLFKPEEIAPAFGRKENLKLVERFQNNIAFIRQPRRLSYTCDSYRLIQ